MICSVQTGSIFITLAVTVERYIAVCYPLQFREICTIRKTYISCAIVSIWSIIFGFIAFIKPWAEENEADFISAFLQYSTLGRTIFQLVIPVLVICFLHIWTCIRVSVDIPISSSFSTNSQNNFQLNLGTD